MAVIARTQKKIGSLLFSKVAIRNVNVGEKLRHDLDDVTIENSELVHNSYVGATSKQALLAALDVETTPGTTDWTELGACRLGSRASASPQDEEFKLDGVNDVGHFLDELEIFDIQTTSAEWNVIKSILGNTDNVSVDVLLWDEAQDFVIILYDVTVNLDTDAVGGEKLLMNIRGNRLDADLEYYEVNELIYGRIQATIDDGAPVTTAVDITVTRTGDSTVNDITYNNVVPNVSGVIEFDAYEKYLTKTISITVTKVSGGATDTNSGLNVVRNQILTQTFNLV